MPQKNTENMVLNDLNIIFQNLIIKPTIKALKTPESVILKNP